jgi:hypothetical protein
MHAPVFVLSTGRCGTLALQRFLLHAAPVEPFHRARGRFARYRNDMQILVEQNYAHFEVLLNPACPSARRRRTIARLRRSRMPLIERLAREGRTFVELNHEFSSFGSLLVEAYPGARFVHLIRDPRHVIRSFIQKLDPVPMSLPAYFGTRYSLRGQYALRHGRLRAVAGWLPGPLGPAIATHRYDLHLHPFERRNGRWVEASWPVVQKMAWYWAEMNRTIEATLALVPPDRRQVLRFEDVVDRSTGRLESFLEFVGLPRGAWPDLQLFFGAPVNIKSMHQEFGDAEGAGDFEEALEHHCGEIARKYGYCR